MMDRRDDDATFAVPFNLVLFGFLVFPDDDGELRKHGGKISDEPLLFSISRRLGLWYVNRNINQRGRCFL